MTTFKEFLAEAAKKKDKLPANNVSKWGKEDLSIEKMIEMVNANCRESLRAIQQPSGLLFNGTKINKHVWDEFRYLEE